MEAIIGVAGKKKQRETTIWQKARNRNMSVRSWISFSWIARVRVWPRICVFIAKTLSQTWSSLWASLELCRVSVAVGGQNIFWLWRHGWILLVRSPCYAKVVLSPNRSLMIVWPTIWNNVEGLSSAKVWCSNINNIVFFCCHENQGHTFGTLCQPAGILFLHTFFLSSERFKTKKCSERTITLLIFMILKYRISSSWPNYCKNEKKKKKIKSMWNTHELQRS